MSKNTKHVCYAHRILWKIREALGAKCAHCGATDLDAPLELDHKLASSRTWRTRDHGLKGSALRYRKDFQNGKLQLLCRRCHEIKTWGY